jgi:HlyD family secretion protein
MKKKILPVILALVILGAAVMVWKHFRDGKDASNTLTLYGNADIRQVQIAFKTSERIETMLAREGDAVRKGDLLATLDTDRLAANVALRKAQLAAQQQIVARLEAGSRPEEIAQARAGLDAARIDAANALRTYSRLNDLAQKHFISEQQADNARTAAEGAEARSRSAAEVLKLAQEGPRKEDIASAKSVLDADRVALSIAAIDLQEASLHAPSDGVIQDRILEPGDMASPQKPVYTLALTNPVWVRTYVPESDLGKLKIGMRAEVATDSYPDKRYKAWVGYISPSAEFTPKSVETAELRTSLSYQVRIFVCNPGNELRLGMPATVTVPLAARTIKAEPCKAR